MRAAGQHQQLMLRVEDQEYLFERFFRARNVSTVPGTALVGLYIVARHLELMRSTVALIKIRLSAYPRAATTRNPVSRLKTGFFSGPTWNRTKDLLIMSQLL